MIDKSYSKHSAFLAKIIVGIIGVLLLSYLISCNSENQLSTTETSTPPSAVRDLKAEVSIANQVTLSWTAPADAGTTDGITPATISGYLVRYKVVDSDFIEIDEKSEGVRLAEALTNTSTYATVTNLDGNTDYTFLVVAVNSGNAEGPDTADSRIEVTTSPLPPSNLRETSPCLKTIEVKLAWDASSGATSYNLYRDDAPTPIVSTNTTTYTDTGFIAGTSYTYTVRACKGTNCSGDSDPLTITTRRENWFKKIIYSGRIPADITDYDEMSQEIFSHYKSDTSLVVKYLKPNARGKGDSPDSPAGNLKDIIDGITDATANKVYVVLLSGGNYKAGSAISIKKHVAIIGGIDEYECPDFSDTATTLDGEGSYRVFHNNDNGLDDTALLYGVTITNGYSDEDGGGMYNKDSSPSLVRVAFSGNRAIGKGGGIYNENSSPIMTNITFSGNTADERGGGMYNKESSPSLVRATFYGNRADQNGGGIYNENSSPIMTDIAFSGNTATNYGGGMYNEYSSPIMTDIIFSENTANYGGGMYNKESSPSLVGITFSGNTANERGGGMYNDLSSPSLIGATFSGNTAGEDGGGMYNENNSSPNLVGATFSGNRATDGGGIYNYNSSPNLIGATFSGNTATNYGGGIYNYNSSPNLVGTTFFENSAVERGGGMYNNNDGNPGPLILNSIFWSNTAGSGMEFYLHNDGTDQESLRVYNSIIGDGISNLVSKTVYTNINQGGFVSDGGSAPVVISFDDIFFTTNFQLNELADNGGSVLTHAIPSGSEAVDKGLYVRKKDSNFYYSTNNTAWYTEPDLSGTPENRPADAEDLTATDARGVTRVGRPDLGAYEAR